MKRNEAQDLLSYTLKELFKNDEVSFLPMQILLHFFFIWYQAQINRTKFQRRFT
jgi:hypothetical protein